MLNSFYTSLPAQKLAESRKDKSWRETCVDAIAGFGQSRTNGRTTRYKKKTNYNLVNSIFDPADLDYVLNPYGADHQAGVEPAQMRCMNIIAAKLNLLKGEETARPFDFTVVGKNGSAVDSKEDKKKEILMQVANSIVERAAGINVPQDPNVPQNFTEAEKYIKMSLKDMREEWGNAILEHLKEDQKLKLRFNEGWEHALISGEELYYVGIVNKEPRLRTVNPINFDFDKNPDDACVENGDWAREDRFMSVGQIIDEFGEFLTDDQIESLDKRDFRVSGNLDMQTYPGFAYTQDELKSYDRYNSDRAHLSYFTVTTVVWKSLKKVGFVSYMDPETGDKLDTMVDEGYKLTDDLKELGATIEWKWITEVWKGTKIGEDLYADINPLPYQLRSLDNPYESKLPYIGRVYNATNSICTSLVDLMKPYQYMYNIMWYRLEAEIAKSKGKKFVMDMAMIPKSQGMDMDRWMYNFDTLGIAFINSMEEGKNGDPNLTSKFNQFTSIDMSMSQTVVQYIGIMNKLEDMISEVSGVTRQRQGQTFATETAQGVERSVSQSSYITEPYFYLHNEVKKQVLTQLLEVAKIAYDGSKKIHYILDDVERIFLEIDMDKFSDSEYGVFVSNSLEDKLLFQKLEGLAQAAMQNGTLKFSDLIKMYKTKSIARLSADLEQAEENRIKQQQEQQQIQNQIAQQQIAQEAADKQADRDNENMNNQLDRENKIQVATLTGLGFSQDKDIDNDGVPDMVEQNKIALKQSEIAAKQIMQAQKLAHESSEAAKDRSLEKEKIEATKQIARSKPKPK